MKGIHWVTFFSYVFSFLSKFKPIHIKRIILFKSPLKYGIPKIKRKKNRKRKKTLKAKSSFFSLTIWITIHNPLPLHLQLHSSIFIVDFILQFLSLTSFFNFLSSTSFFNFHPRLHSSIFSFDFILQLLSLTSSLLFTLHLSPTTN